MPTCPHAEDRDYGQISSATRGRRQGQGIGKRSADLRHRERDRGRRNLRHNLLGAGAHSRWLPRLISTVNGIRNLNDALSHNQ